MLYVTIKPSVNAQHYFNSSKGYMFWEHKTAIIRLQVSEIQKGNNLAVAIHTTIKTYSQDLALTQKYL